jgi:hypothetical protein
LPLSGLSALSIIFILAAKEGEEYLCTRGGKAIEGLERLLMAIVQIDLAQQLVWSQCSMLRGQSQIMIYFSQFLDIVACIPILSKTDFNMIQIIGIILSLTKIVILSMRSMVHTSHLWTSINHHNIFCFFANDILYSQNLSQNWKETEIYMPRVTIHE